MTTTETQAKTIDGRARTVRELLDKAKYAIDFYQREYAWKERQVRELIDDLAGKFLDAYEAGHSWTYTVLQDATRAELYVDSPVAADNKALFDTLYGHRTAIESDFGGSLSWQRLDDKRACRISFTVPGGWVDDRTWPVAIEQSVSAMLRLYGALLPRVVAAGQVSKGAV